jgi:hypothetical protein
MQSFFITPMIDSLLDKGGCFTEERIILFLSRYVTVGVAQIISPPTSSEIAEMGLETGTR